MCFPWFISNFSLCKSFRSSLCKLSLLRYDNILKVPLKPNNLQMHKTKNERGSVGLQKWNDLLIVT